MLLATCTIAYFAVGTILFVFQPTETIHELFTTISFWSFRVFVHKAVTAGLD